MWLLIILNLAGKVAALLVGWSAPAAGLALWFGPDLLLAYHMFVPNASGLVRMHRRFATPRREVWLTIDDGPDPEDTPQIITLLAAQGARATFFVIGERAAAHPALIRAITAAGHEVAHHTYTHPLGAFWCASPARVARELDDGLAALREPLVFILHLGYGWLGLGLVLLGANGLYPLLPATAALHALTAGAIGTMTLAVMTRATLGHSGRPLAAGPGTLSIYALVTLAAVFRLVAPLAGAQVLMLTWIAGAAWCGAFGLFALLYGASMILPRNA